MAQPMWRSLGDFTIPARPDMGRFWTPTIDVLQGPRLLRISVKGSPPINWNPSPIETCSPNGSVDGTPALLAPNAARGTLIGKLGGSTSDLPSADPAKYDNARVFAVGDHAVIRVLADEVGPLYFTMNDTTAGFPHHSGQIEIQLEEMDI